SGMHCAVLIVLMPPLFLRSDTWFPIAEWSHIVRYQKLSGNNPYTARNMSGRQHNLPAAYLIELMIDIYFYRMNNWADPANQPVFSLSLTLFRLLPNYQRVDIAG